MRYNARVPALATELLTLLLQVAWADGEVQAEERLLIEQLGRKLAVPEPKLARLLEYLARGEPLPAPNLDVLRDHRAIAEQSVRALVEVDGITTAQERALMDELHLLLAPTAEDEPRSAWVVVPHGPGPVIDWVKAAHWSVAALPKDASVLVVSPEAVPRVSRTVWPTTRPIVAVMPLISGFDALVHPNAARHVGFKADAYAATKESLADALAFVRTERRWDRAKGPLRLTWLGALGTVPPMPLGPPGRSYPLELRLTVGSASENDVRIVQGAHADQNTVSRHHAVIDLTEERVVVSDQGSARGTFVNGERVRRHVLEPGDLLSLAGVHHFRLDGDF